MVRFFPALPEKAKANLAAKVEEEQEKDDKALPTLSLEILKLLKKMNG
ncbi:MAG: hypothetical protein KAT04_06725 [Methylococcales bacterium]|nr:hypothetical protein [Methylococcales bacterium]